MVHGLLTASGTEQDSIVFTRRYSFGVDTSWGGLRFFYADENTNLAYCVIEHARSLAYNLEEAGGGILLYTSEIQVSHCSIRRNHVIGSWMYAGGGGIHSFHSDLELDDCSIEENQSYFAGAGIYLWGGGSATMSNCRIRDNIAESSGGGIYSEGSQILTMTDCEITGNQADTYGSSAGVVCYSPGMIQRCLIADNHGGGGVYASHEDLVFRECLITQNYGGYASGVRAGTAAVFERCTIAGNQGYSGAQVYFYQSSVTLNSCIVFAIGSDPVLFFSESPSANVRYCNMWSTGSDSLIGFDDSSEVPLALGLIALTNPNGDSCDTYYNIFMDPQFADTANGDYHLTANSPCIDAGDPELLPDPDGTVADIGAFYFNQLSADERPILPPSSFSLSAYPNPFNASTQIVFELPRADNVELAVFDLAGRLVETLYSGRLEAGRHEFSLNARDWPSSIYFYRLQHGMQIETRKMILLK